MENAKPNKKSIVTNITIGFIGVCAIILATFIYLYWPQHGNLPNETVQPTQTTAITPKPTTTETPINTPVQQQKHVITHTTPFLSKTAFSIELAQYALNVQHHTHTAISWLQEAIETAAKQETQELLLTAVEHIRQQNTTMNIERLLLQFHSLSEHIQFAFINTNPDTAKPTIVQQQPSTTNDFDLWDQAQHFLQSNLLVTRQTQRQNTTFSLKMMNQQQDVSALLRQAELALSLRYNGYFHTIIQDIQQALPNVVVSSQINGLSEQLSHYNQYNISYQPYSLSHLLSLDLSDKISISSNTHGQPEKNTLNRQITSEKETVHTALLQPITPTITEAF